MVNIEVDDSLIKWALLPLEFGQAAFAHRVTASQADGSPTDALKLIAADQAGEEVSPLRSLNRHCRYLMPKGITEKEIFIIIEHSKLKYQLYNTGKLQIQVGITVTT